MMLFQLLLLRRSIRGLQAIPAGDRKGSRGLPLEAMDGRAAI